MKKCVYVRVIDSSREPDGGWYAWKTDTAWYVDGFYHGPYESIDREDLVPDEEDEPIEVRVVDLNPGRLRVRWLAEPNDYKIDWPDTLAELQQLSGGRWVRPERAAKAEGGGE